MAQKSLWPAKFDVAPEPTPDDMLENQAGQLESATGGKLSARIDIGSIGDKVSLDFMVIAPALNGYEYRLFSVLHRVHPAFSAEFIVGDQRRVTTTRQEFEIQLASILQSKETVRLVSELIDLIKKRQKVEKSR